MKITFPVVLLAFLYFFFHELYGEIRGKVIDQTSGKPIKDVEITIPGTRIGVISDAEGFFKIEHQSKEKKIQLSHIAYENQYMTLNEIDTAIVVKLKESLLHMEDIVVTSMRSGYLLRDVPVSTEVISKKEISSSGAITVDEIMSQRAGVSSSVNVDGGAIFNLLGLDSRYILVLKNGQPITGRFNNRVDLSQISLNRVQKIEITKGPGSALYGTDAMGGIINIITDDDSSEEYNLSYRATTFGSNLSQIKTEPINNVLSGNIVYPIKNFIIYSDITFQNFFKGQQFEYISADEIDKTNTNTELRWILNNRHLFFLNIQTFNQNDNGSTRTAFGDVLFNNSTKIVRSQVSFKYDWNYSENAKLEQSFRISNYRRNYSVINKDNEIYKKDLTKEKDIEYEVMYTKSYPKFNLVYGMEFSRPEYISDRIIGGNQLFYQNGVFIQTDIDIFENIDFVTGIRVDRFQDTVVVSPRLAISYKSKNNLKFRGAYGSGFRSPSFMESLIDWEHVQFDYRVIGNQNLKPEVSKGLTLGAEYTNNSNFQLSILIYKNNFKNLIEDYSIEPGVLSYRNISIAKFSGFELTSKWAIGSKASLSNTYNYVENVDGNDKTIPNTIPHSLGSRFSLSFLQNTMLLSLITKISGSYYPQEFDPGSGDYISTNKAVNTSIVSDFIIQYTLSGENKIKFGLKNLGNYTNSTYGPYIGRVAYLEIQKSINNNK